MSLDWTKRERTEFIVTFYGDPEQSHEIETQAITDCINAIAATIIRANTLLNGKQSEVFLKIKGSPKVGSLEINLVTLLNNDGINSFLNLVEILGLAGILPGGGISVFKFFKILKNRKILSALDSQDKNGNNCVNITIEGDNNTVILPRPVYDIYQDKEFRREAEAIPAPLDNGLKKISFSKDANEPLEIVPAEIPYFRGIETTETNETSEMLILEIIQSRQDGSLKGWRFSTGDTEFSAEVKDRNFLDMIVNKKISITHGDMIKAKVDIIQRQGIRISTDREITKVIAYNGKIMELTLDEGQTTLTG
jgi:hypothetical protein